MITEIWKFIINMKSWKEILYKKGVTDLLKYKELQ